MEEFNDKTNDEVGELFFLEKSENLRGETPEDIKEKCLKLCAEYLSGSWKNLTADQFNFRRISGGLTNQLYYCALPDGVFATRDEPTEVVIKFYGNKWFNNNIKRENERLNDLVLVLMTSKYNLGPKVYGLFGEGEIGEYIESHQFRAKEETDPLYTNELSRKLAHFHSLQPPISKDINWYKNFFNQFYKKAYDLFPIEELIQEINAQYLMNTDVKQEFEWLLKNIEAFDSPIVFSHNDFRGCNILVREKADSNSLISLCDFEYSSYFYRGFDFGAYFYEWGKSDSSNQILFPSDEIIENFMKGYIQESVKIHGEKFVSNEQNSIQHLIKETKLFALAEGMFIIAFLLGNEEKSFNTSKKDFVKGANDHLEIYLALKKKFLEGGEIPVL